MNIAVFCSSADEVRPPFLEAAWQLGCELAARHATVVHGGASEGLMGRLLHGAVSANGRVIGVVTAEIAGRETPSMAPQELIYTSTLAERKNRMIDLADEFLILPGGFGTLDETCEIITRKQLALSDKPIGFINVLGYWDLFFRFLENAESEGMIVTKNRTTFTVYDSVEQAMDAFDARF